MEHGLLPFSRQRDFFKLAVSDNDAIVVPGGNPRAKAFPVLLFKVLFGRHEDIGRRVQLQKIRSKITDDVVGNHKQCLAGQPQALGFHCGGDHGVGFPSPHHMAEQGIAAVNCPRHRIALMRAQLLFRVHPGKYKMAHVILAGTNGIELIIVNPADPVAAAGFRPNPFLKLLFDEVLLVLRDCGFLFVQHTGFPPVCIILGIENPHVPQIQRILDNLVGIDSLCAVGVVGTDVAAVKAFF